MSGATGRPWGRTRRRLAGLLARHGIAVNLLFAAQGRERSDPREDIYRWEAWGVDSDGLRVSLCSYDTMTSCVRRGIELVRGHDRQTPHWQIDVYARANLVNQKSKEENRKP